MCSSSAKPFFAGGSTEFEDIPYPKLTLLNLDGGVLVKKLGEGKWKNAGIKKDFIITHIDKVSIDNVGDLNIILEFKKGGVLVEGVDLKGKRNVIGLDW